MCEHKPRAKDMLYKGAFEVWDRRTFCYEATSPGFVTVGRFQRLRPQATDVCSPGVGWTRGRRELAAVGTQACVFRVLSHTWSHNI